VYLVLTQQLLACAAGDLFDFHAGEGERVRGGDERGGGHHGGGRRGQDLVDQRGLEGSFDAAAHQVTQRDLEHVLTCRFTWWWWWGGGNPEEEKDGMREEQQDKVREKIGAT